jgi:HEAT repeat protein
MPPYGIVFLVAFACGSDPFEAKADPLDATIPALVKALKDPDPDVRTHAASALCSLDRRALPALLKLLEGKDKELKVQAAGVIASMTAYGRRHVEALPALTKALGDEDAVVRRSAAAAISGIAVKALEKSAAGEGR